METKMQEQKHRQEDRVVRILSKDIEGKMNVYVGFTKVKGVSWSLSNVVCKKFNIDKKRKIGSLTDEEIKRISDFIKDPKVPAHLLNRQKDFETGENKHFIGSD